MSSKLTICTVSFKNKAHIELNQHLTERLNPSEVLQWLIVENSPEGTPDVFVPSSNENVLVLSGASFNPEHPRPASNHHAQAIQLALQHINTPYLLILDPDFYIVMPKWANEVVQYMEENDIAVLGVPWHPRWWTKYRQFPAMHCIFFNLQHIDPNDLDFSPGTYVINKKQNPSGESATTKPKPLPFYKYITHRLMPDEKLRARLHKRTIGPMINLLKSNFRSRRYIGKTPDTGYEFYQRIQHKKLNVQFIPVVFHAHEYPLAPRFINRMIDNFLPDRLRFLPKAPNYYVKRGFKAAGLPDTTQYACEEFMWQGQPFGFHVRSVPRTIKQNPLSIEQLSEIIENITAKLDLPTSQP